MEDDRSVRRLRRLAHPGRALAFLLIIVVIGVGAFILGTLVRSPDASVLDARDQTVAVYASAESRVVSDEVRIQGEAMGTATQPVYVDPPDGAAFAVVTSIAAETGSELPNGTLLGTVSDRPVFVFSVQVPLFRDLRRGDSGSDVANLQAALGVEQSGEVDGATLDAVRQLYASVDIEPPGGDGYNTYIKLTEFHSVPQAGQLRLASITPVGSRLGPDTPFASLGTGAPYINVRASVSEAGQIALGSEVTVQRSGNASVAGVVASIGEFESAGTDSGRPPGRDIHVDVPVEAALAPGEPVSVVFGAEGEPLLAVPTLAIRSDVQGEYILKDAMGTETERISVEVLRNAQGWTAIDTPELRVGDRVLVAG